MNRKSIVDEEQKENLERQKVEEYATSSLSTLVVTNVAISLFILGLGGIPQITLQKYVSF